MNSKENTNEDTPHPWSDLLGKYIEVWLYSIQFGVLSGVTFSFISFRYDVQRWGYLGVPLTILVLAGAVAAIMSWYALLGYLARRLLPRFVLRDEASAATPRKAALYLYRSLWFMIMALVLRLIAAIFDLTMQWLLYSQIPR